MTGDKLKIGTKLLGERESRKLTQGAMAELLGIPLTTYVRYERNETAVDFERINKIAEALQVPIQEL